MPVDFPAEWNVLPVDGAVEAVIDYRGKSPRKTSSGVPLVTAKIVKNGRILEPDEFIAIADYDAWMRRGVPRSGDVVLTTEAPLGEIAQLGEQRVALAQRLIVLRAKRSIVDNTFLKYAMMSPFVQEQLHARATGTTVFGIKQSELRRVRVPLPPYDEQLAIARVLGALDENIELNRRLNRTLETIAAAAFRSWFVDFDPVVAKADGRQPFGLDGETANLFPARFIESRRGPIPDGWLAGVLGDVSSNVRRAVSPDQIDPSIPYIGLEHMPRKSILLSEWGSAGTISSGKSGFHVGEVLFGKLRPYFHKVGMAPVSGVCSTDILVLVPNTPAWFGFLLGHASSREFVSYADATSGGTKMPRASWRDLSRYPVAIPPVEVASRFTSLISPLAARIRANIHQARTLAALSDALLPRLLSGELRPMEAEQLVAST